MSNQSSSPPHLDVILGQTNLESAVQPIVEAVRPEWQLKTVKFRLFTEGISNKLIGAYTGPTIDDDPKAILIRIYGINTDLLIDREEEKNTFRLLHSHGCGAPLHLTFSNGCCYGYIAGRALDIEDVYLSDIYLLIIRRMVHIHGIRSDGPTHTGSPMLFRTLEKWMRVVSTDMKTSEQTERMKKFIPSKAKLLQEVEVLRNSLVPLKSQVVFCHNDLLVKNIILSKTADCVMFIDYEYAGYNYRAFDIADHFCEFAGVDEVDYSRYPNKAFQLQWLQIYLEETAKQTGSGSPVMSQDVENLYVKVNKFALAAHLFWGLWALVQARHSDIDFDFLGSMSSISVIFTLLSIVFFSQVCHHSV
jgi:ethanolamine kinase